MAFAGVSLVGGDGKLCASTVSPIDCGAASGYHLLVVEGYSRTRDMPPTGEYIRSRTFLVGGHRWYLKYYPNGCDSKCAGCISVSLNLEDDADGDKQAPPLNARSTFSFIDQFQWLESVDIHDRQIQDFRVDAEMLFGNLMKREIMERSAHLKDDSFVIRCDVVVVGADITADGADNQVPPTDMSIHFRNLLLTKEGADVTFEVNGTTFAAHRCVLAARSTVFKAQLSSGVLEGATVKITDIDADVFDALLCFIYTDTMPIPKTDDMEEEIGEEDEDISWLLQLLEAADRYELHRLKLMCQELLVASIYLSTVADIIVVAQRSRCRLLKEQCLDFIRSHTSLLKVFTGEEVQEMARTCSPSILNKLLSQFAS
ncbi:hypothetical protein QYE76_028244 [Lolium multiflorum]|uniref:Uncharacterized protein n=1 Tax=Lolium multiflorum TaxID=4521 RepID=A0AAD8QLY3_LOLMU|nr:hypothetical protein QYE76_028244 [Lolium multiflorum]